MRVRARERGRAAWAWELLTGTGPKGSVRSAVRMSRVCERAGVAWRGSERVWAGGGAG